MLFYGVNLCECWCGGEARKGNRFIFGHSNRGVNNPRFGKKHSDEARKKMSKPHSEEWNKKVSEAKKGIKFTEEHCKHISESRLLISDEIKEYTKRNWQNPEYIKNQQEKLIIAVKKCWEDSDYREAHSGENNGNWKGGISVKYENTRLSANYKNWVVSVYKRDYYTCHKCGMHCNDLNAHHIINFAKLVQEDQYLWDINNGITFCKNCHYQFHHLFGIKNNDAQQIFEFIYLQGIY